jgi:hypothetical protein
MAKSEVSAGSTSNLVVAFSNFQQNSESICDRIVSLCKQLTDEDAGILVGADGERAAQTLMRLADAVTKLKEDAATINVALDQQLSKIIGLDKNATADLDDKMKKSVDSLGNIAKKH